MREVKEAKDLSKQLKRKHRKWKEKELDSELKITMLKEDHERELE